jgi:hypothetical protein
MKVSDGIKLGIGLAIAAAIITGLVGRGVDR